MHTVPIDTKHNRTHTDWHEHIEKHTFCAARTNIRDTLGVVHRLRLLATGWFGGEVDGGLRWSWKFFGEYFRVLGGLERGFRMYMWVVRQRMASIPKHTHKHFPRWLHARPTTDKRLPSLTIAFFARCLSTSASSQSILYSAKLQCTISPMVVWVCVCLRFVLDCRRSFKTSPVGSEWNSLEVCLLAHRQWVASLLAASLSDVSLGFSLVFK